MDKKIKKKNGFNVGIIEYDWAPVGIKINPDCRVGYKHMHIVTGMTVTNLYCSD